MFLCNSRDKIGKDRVSTTARCTHRLTGVIIGGHVHFFSITLIESTVVTNSVTKVLFFAKDKYDSSFISSSGITSVRLLTGLFGGFQQVVYSYELTVCAFLYLLFLFCFALTAFQSHIYCIYVT